MGADVGVKKGPRSDINITPLVDVVLVLLIIFMVLTPLMEKELSVRVPEEIPPDMQFPPPDPEARQYIFRVDAEGKFSINGTAITDDKAAEELKKYYREAKSIEAKNGPPIVFFEADDKAKYVRAVRGLDLIRDSSPGWTIGMMTDKLVAADPGAPGAPGEAPPVPAPPK